MTREEALAYAISQKAGVESELYRTPCGYGNWAVYSTVLDFINAAISALRGPTREQVEKMRGEWIGIPNMGVYDIACSKCGYSTGIRFWSSDFCPNCGDPLTDEAVDMVMERINKMEETGDGLG